jgi:hypothetical protein
LRSSSKNTRKLNLQVITNTIRIKFGVFGVAGKLVKEVTFQLRAKFLTKKFLFQEVGHSANNLFWVSRNFRGYRRHQYVSSL